MSYTHSSLQASCDKWHEEKKESKDYGKPLGTMSYAKHLRVQVKGKPNGND